MSDRHALMRSVADAIVADVCDCTPMGHTRGFPECARAVRAARKAVDILVPKVHCQGSNRKPAETVILDVVPGMRPSGTCITCNKSFTLNIYDKIPDHES